MSEFDYVIDVPEETNVPPNVEERTGWENVVFVLDNED